MESKPITTVETNTRLAETLIEEHINNMHHAEKNLSGAVWENFESFTWCCEHSPVKARLRSVIWMLITAA